jgi:ATP-dependent exoDNAse (exonuclease V) alpha subunit
LKGNWYVAMAIYHFTAQIIGRSSGRSAVAASAYRAGERFHDERLNRDHDFTNKSGVVHSEVLLPEHAPDEWRNRERLWNDVEAFEKRKDAQLAREVEFAIPRELNQQQGIELAREFVRAEFVDHGMIADLNVHWDYGVDGLAKPHAHVMLTMREVGHETGHEGAVGNGFGEHREPSFGAKVREWNQTSQVERWRERWAEHVNTRLAELDIDARVDHRSLEAQGIALEPQHKIGPAAARMEDRGHASERLAEHHAIARSNGERILADPAIALDAITHGQATFTHRDLAMFAHRHSEGKEQFDSVMAAMRASAELVRLGRDGRG